MTEGVRWVRVVGGVVGFGVVTGALLLAPVRSVDLGVRDFVDGHRPGAAEFVAQNLNRLGSGGLLASAALLVALWMCWRRGSWRPVVPVVAAFVLTSVVIGLLKVGLDRAAPHALLADDVKVRLFGQPEGVSYPSGHAVNAIVWFGVILTLVGRTVPSWVRVVPPFVVCVAGTYLGYHWLTDMLAGACLGVALDGLLRRRQRRRSRTSWRDLEIKPRRFLLDRRRSDAEDLYARG